MSKSMNINDVQRKKPTTAQITRAKKNGFIFGRMSANTQADQVSKMLFSEQEAKKK